MIPCCFCSQDGVIRKATICAPQYDGGDFDESVTFRSVCPSHFERWYDDIPENERIPAFALTADQHAAHPEPSIAAAAPAAPAAVKMTAAELLTKFPDMEGKHPSDEQESDSLLLDMACPACGQRDRFRIGFHGTADVDDDSSSDDGDHEWDADDHCTCQKCSHRGDVKDFTFDGLDDLIAEQEEPDQDTE
jgi:hypothetical protein